MKISDIRDPRVFETLVHRLMVAERGGDFHIPDDSGGDRGNDGYDVATGILYAIYCPEKPVSANYRRKALGDLAKAARLANEPGYTIARWVFVTPTPLREQLQAEIRAAAMAMGLQAGFLADAHLEDLLRKHPHIRDEIPSLEYPQVAQQLKAIRAPLSPLRVFFTFESNVPDEDLARVFAKHRGYRLYAPGQPQPDFPDGPPPSDPSCRLFHSDGFLDFSDGRLTAAGLIHLMGRGFPFIHRRATHTVCRVRRESLRNSISSNEPLCMQPKVLVEIVKDVGAGRTDQTPAIVFRSDGLSAHDTLRLCAIDNAVFADFLTKPMSATRADVSAWSMFDLEGSTIRFTFTGFYVDGINDLPEASWPRLVALQLLVGDRYVISIPDGPISEQRAGRAMEVNIASGAVMPTILVECSLPSEDFVRGLQDLSGQ